MAKRRNNRMAENIGDFAGPDADRENIEKLAKAAEEANAKAGHNSGEPSDEVIDRNFDSIEVAWVEIDAAGRVMQQARAALKAARTTAKTDMGSKAWVDSVEAAVKLKRQTDKGGSSELVAEHRQIGRILRIKNVAIGTQFGLYAFPEVESEAPKDDKTLANEAFLAGEHAGLNAEPIDNCPHPAGSPQAFGWRNGHQIGADKLSENLRTGHTQASGGAAAH